MIKNKYLLVVMSFLLLFAVISVSVSAHVIVKPNQAGVASFQTFTMGVPNEKDSSTTTVKLVIPEGLQFVSPNVKPGWRIEMKKSGEGDSAKVTEIDWTEGSIPSGQRDDFVFSVQVPANETTVNWKAYQTYQNGEVVSWDQDPDGMKNMSDKDKEKAEKEGKGPYSQTKIINDLKTSPATNQEGKQTKISTILSVAAIILSVVAIGLGFLKK